MSVSRWVFTFVFLFGVCGVQAKEQASVNSEIQKDTKKESPATQKQNNNKGKKTSRSLSSRFFQIFSKKEVFGEDYEDVDASQDVSQANQILSSLERACEFKNVKRKVRYLNKRFHALTKLSNEYLEGKLYVSPEDKLFFLIIRDLLDVKNINYGRPIEVQSVSDTDLRLGFKMYYFSQNNLPFSTDVSDFPDVQAQHIYKGIECLY